MLTNDATIKFCEFEKHQLAKTVLPVEDDRVRKQLQWEFIKLHKIGNNEYQN